jgi:predicted lysophospholipase L1 biosynthesis ABC-type transport system permease subunit
VIVTSNATDANVRQFRIGSHSLGVIILVLCIIIGVMLGYIAYEEKIWKAVGDRNSEQLATIRSLESEKEQLTSDKLELESEINGLNETVQILSETVSQKTQSESDLMEQLEKQSMPTEFPLNGSASMTEKEGDNPLCEFTASEGTAVVATASGTVTGINDDVDYGHNVWVDHGNGYVTIYRNAGDPQVKIGDLVVSGTTLFAIGTENEKLGYQMMKDGEYIDPMEMLSISG